MERGVFGHSVGLNPLLLLREKGGAKRRDEGIKTTRNLIHRLLFTQDDDFLIEAKQRQMTGKTFGGIIYAHQREVSIGQCIHDLEIIALAGTATDAINYVFYVPM